MNQRMIKVVDYDPRWQGDFEIERGLLAKTIGDNAIAIEHIGSTAVEGLAAKPIIDILIEVKCLVDLDKLNSKIATLDYLVKGENGIEGRRYFQKGGVQHSHHVHVFQSGDYSLFRHRAFKEYLIAHPKILAEYGQIKKAAMLNCGNNIDNYMSLKNDFIQTHEKLAVKWFGQR